MSILTCDAGSWSLFEDPIPDEASIADEVLNRINNEEKYSKLEASAYEKKITHIKRFLGKNSFDVESTLGMWSEWVAWRRSILVDSITDDEIAFERTEGTMSWRGHNKAGLKCLVVTGRLMDPVNRRGTCRSFKRYLIKTIEEGLQATDDLEEDRMCIVYDRRGLEFQHIDPNMFNFCKPLIEEMQKFYGDRLGAIYVLGANVFLWLIYNVFVYPSMSVFYADFNKKFILVDSAADMLRYFDEDQLLLNAVDDSARHTILEQLNIMDNNITPSSSTADFSDSTSVVTRDPAVASNMKR